jgi:hypothetical protein
MKTENHRAAEILGLVELDHIGIILHSRMERAPIDENSSLLAPYQDINGLNFFTQVARFRNVSDFQERLDAFRTSGKQAQSFDFDCEYEDGNYPVHVLLARVTERADLKETKSILVQIKSID